MPLRLHNDAVADGRSGILDEAPPALEAVELAIAVCRAGVDGVRDADLNFVVSRLDRAHQSAHPPRWRGFRQPRCTRRTQRSRLPHRGRSPRPESFAVRGVAPQQVARPPRRRPIGPPSTPNGSNHEADLGATAPTTRPARRTAVGRRPCSKRTIPDGASTVRDQGAEGMGFEPMVTRRPQRLSRPPHSSALATFRGRRYQSARGAPKVDPGRPTPPPSGRAGDETLVRPPADRRHADTPVTRRAAPTGPARRSAGRRSCPRRRAAP